MKANNRRGNVVTANQPPRSRAMRRIGRAGILSTAFAVAFLAAAALSANAATTIYMYDSSGAPQDVSTAYSVQNGQVYDGFSNVVGAVDASGNIYDSTMHLIGYITVTPGP